MKTVLPLSVLLLLFQVSFAGKLPLQPLTSFEAGITLTTFNTYTPKTYSNTFNVLDRRAYEFVNTLFFRYTHKRWGIRLFTGYSQNKGSLVQTGANALRTTINNKDFRAGIGAQYYFAKHWCYSFLDLAYRDVYSTGSKSGTNLNQTFVQVSKGFDTFLGIGFRIRIYKIICISPEIAYLGSAKFFNISTTNLNSPVVHQTKDAKFYSFAVARLIATVRF